MDEKIDREILLLVVAGALALVAFIYVFAIREPTPTPWTGVVSVNCYGESSMGLTIGCEDTLELQSIQRYDKLEVGRIYVYEAENMTIVHRLVYCPDNCKRQALFKGDANYEAEMVNRSQVKWLVTSINTK